MAAILIGGFKFKLVLSLLILAVMIQLILFSLVMVHYSRKIDIFIWSGMNFCLALIFLFCALNGLVFKLLVANMILNIAHMFCLLVYLIELSLATSPQCI